MSKYRVTTDGGTYEITTDEASKPPTVPGTEKLGGQPPKAGQSPRVNMPEVEKGLGGVGAGLTRAARFGVGAAKGAARDLYSAGTSGGVAGPVGALAGYIGHQTGLDEKVEKATEPEGGFEKAGNLTESAATLIQPIGAGVKALQAARAARAATKGASAVEAVAGKIPKVHPFAKFLAKRLPGVGTALDIVEGIRSMGSGEVPAIPKGGRDELAAQLWKETTGKLPETAKEKIQAIKGLREALKPTPAAKEKYPPSKSLAHELYEETHGEAPRGAEKKIQAIKDLRKAMREKPVKEESKSAAAAASGGGESTIAKPTAKTVHNQGPLQKAARILVDGGYGPEEARTMLKTLGTSEQDIVETIANMRTLGK